MVDKELKQLLEKETKRQSGAINLIASEGLIFSSSKEVLSSDLSQKYAEGYPHARYYEGTDVVDELEELTQKRAREIFKLSAKKWHVNTQAYSGSIANQAVLGGLLKSGDAAISLNLSHGGHLSHGAKVSLTNNLANWSYYHVDKETGLIDYEEVLSLATSKRPKVIVAGASAYSRKINYEALSAIAKLVGAILIADISHVAGLMAGGAMKKPFRYADVVMTTTHKTLRCARGALIYSRIDDRKLPKKINKALFPGIQGGPHMQSIAGICSGLLEVKSPDFKVFAKQTIKNSKALSLKLKSLGYKILTGGTDNHMVIINVYDTLGIGAKKAASLLSAEKIITNKNMVPFDKRKPSDPSGIRLGTAFETARGLKEKDFTNLAIKIDKILVKGSKTKKK